MDLGRLLSFDSLLSFYSGIAKGSYPVREREEWLKWFNGNEGRLEKVLTTICRILYSSNKEVIYPLEFIVVPRYPFSKTPMIQWSKLQDKTPTDYTVNNIKYYCSRLGKLINTAVITRNIVVVDIDGKPEELKKYADVETRRGFHIVRFIPGYEALKVNNTTKMVFYSNKLTIEVMSGRFYLWSYPLQSRYLVFDGRRVNVYSYKVLSRQLQNALASGDIEPIKTSPEEFKELLSAVLSEVGLEGYARKLEVKPCEKIETKVEGCTRVNPKLSRFNVNPVYTFGAYSYHEFKELLSKRLNMLPTCFKIALYGSPVKGSRYFHLRLLLAVLPFFIVLNEENIDMLVEDFSSRTESKPSEVREWIYYTKYFTGKIKVDGKEIHTASRLGVPQEAWTFFETAGYCGKCPISALCCKLEYGKRRRNIVEYLNSIIELSGGASR